MIAQLEAPEASSRRWAARDLADFPGSCGALLDRLRREHDLSVRAVILTTLTSLGDETAVVGLVDCLRSEDVALRNEAIEALQELPDAVAVHMRGLLADENADVRIFAVNVLGALRHPEVESWLLAVIDRDAHVNVCGTAVDVLVEVGSKAACESLLRLKARFPDEPYIQFAVDLAIKRSQES